MSVPVIEVDHVNKDYPGPLRVLDDVSVAIDDHEEVAIIGPSGSGKSTLLHLMGTLDRPTAGGVRIAGHAVHAMRDAELSGVRATTLGFVFQQFFLIDGLSTLDNVATGLLHQERSRRVRRARAAVVLERVGLAERLTHRPNELSGGERQRVAMARAIVHRPRVVLADEPTGNLDTTTGQNIIDLLRDLNRGGTTLVVITHNHDIASQMDRCIELRDGRVVRDERGVHS